MTAWAWTLVAERPPWWRPIARWRWDTGRTPRLVSIRVIGLGAGERPQLVLTADLVGKRGTR